MEKNKKGKNIILAILIILLLASIIFTMFYAKENVITNFSKDNTFQEIALLKANLPNFYYLIFSIEGLLLSAIIIYLIMSKFNKNSIKETFLSSSKIILCIMFLLILTSVLTLLNTFITNNYFLEKTIIIPNEDNDEDNDDQTNNNVNLTESEITDSTTLSNINYNSTETDKNSLLVNGNINVTLSNINVSKLGDSNGGDSTSFYGTNSAILAKNSANLTLKKITVTTDANGANGVFCYGGAASMNSANGDNTTINISDSKITTTKDNSGGIMTTGGGTMNASNLIINTSGTSSAAIRTDRGGGTVNVDGGTYKTTGQGSPSIYSTANIIVKNSKLISTSSEGIIIEGKNSVLIENVTLTDTNDELNGQSTTYKNIFLYQSMSGDADTGTSLFTANNSTITTNKGDSFYITNTSATINLTNNKITNNDSDGNFLRIQKDSWGKSGSNGGSVILTITNQNITGNIVVDSISTLNMSVKTNSYYEGIINSSNEAKSIALTLDNSSKIKLTGNSYLTSLSDDDSSYTNIDFNGYKLYVNGNAIN